MSDTSEVFHLPFDILGVGSKDDRIVFMPSHRNPALRLSRVEPMDPELLPTIRDYVRGTQPPSKKATETRYLRLKFDGQYDNGDPYRDYELLVNEPLIPTTRTQVEGPRQAIKGDLIRSDRRRRSVRAASRQQENRQPRVVASCVICSTASWSVNGNPRLGPIWTPLLHTCTGSRQTSRTATPTNSSQRAPSPPRS